MNQFLGCITEFKIYNFFNRWGSIIIFVIFFEPKMLFIKLYGFCSVPDIKRYMVNSFKHKLFLLRISLILLFYHNPAKNLYLQIFVQSKMPPFKYLSSQRRI